MGTVIYDSIVLLICIILILYSTVIIHRMKELAKASREKRLNKEAADFIDTLVLNLEEREGETQELIKASEMIKNTYLRKVITERIIIYCSLYSGVIVKRITSFCVGSGLLKYQQRELRRKKHHKIALACRNLGEFRSKSVCKDLLETMGIRSKDVQYHALLALAKIGCEEAFIKAFEMLSEDIILSERALIEIVDSFEGNKTILYKKMMHHPDPGIAAIFIASAGNYMDISVSEEISRFLKDEDKEKRIAAIKSVGKNGDIRFADIIKESLWDEQWEIRAAAAKTIGRMQDSKSLDVLIKLLSDREWWVRYNTAQSIISMKDGINMLKEILSGNDCFAKDSIIAAMDNVGILQDLWLYQYSRNKEKVEVFNLLTDYLNIGESKVK